MSAPTAFLVPVRTALLLGAVAAAVASPPGGAAAAPPVAAASDKSLGPLRKEALAAAVNGSPALRQKVLGRLAAHDSAEAIDLIVRVGLARRHAEVNAAARRALAAHRDDRVFAGLLAERIIRELRGGSPEAAADMAAVLFAAAGGADRGPLQAWLDGDDGDTPEGRRLCWEVASAAAARGAAEDVAALGGLARLRLFQSDFSFRRGVVRALVAIHRLEAIDVLVEILATLRGEARADVVAYLAHVSGVNHGTDADGWRQWFATHREGLVLPGPLPEYPPPTTPLASSDRRGDPAYYGIPLYAERVVFLIDTSGSMEEHGRLETAKRELVSAVFALPQDTAFTIVAFSSRAAVWEQRLVPADEQAKRAAAAFVGGLRPDGMTATGDALTLAFAFDTEAVYLLSDGRPTAGKVTDPADIVRMVAEANHSRRVSLHTIAIAPDRGLAEFLAVLARANFGVARRIDD